ncbi:MAG: PD-(D/E)XK nuclease family protein [Nanoarchaeota archaeon]|nr:PD-(D/E)XK nuclease family protein [Nanoarchaeota archaeon]
MVIYYSHSKLSTFEQCPFKFKLRYVDKIIPEIEKSVESFLGSIVHNTLEWLYLQVQKNNVPELDDVILHYTSEWHENYTHDIKIVRFDMTAQDYFSKGIQFIIDYYMKHKPFGDNTLEVEKKIIVDLEDYKIQGYIDRLVFNPEKDEYEIHDYKTASSLPNQEHADKDRQLALYSIAIKKTFGKDVKLVWHYLAHNKKITSRRTDEQLEDLKKEILELIKKIESTTEFPANKSGLCGWCEYKNMCSEINGDGCCRRC